MTYRLLPLALLFACELPTKIGDLPTTDSDPTDSDATDSDSTDGTDSDPATTGKDTETPGTASATSDDPDTDGPGTLSTTTADPSDTDPGTTGSACDGLDEAACLETPACMANYGRAFAFEQCPVGLVYLGCSIEMSCDAALIPVCKDGTDEVYQKTDGCVPPGFTACETDLGLCEGDCGALTEDECALDFDLCTPIHGAPHVEAQGEICVDFSQQVFLACAAIDGACPPFVPTVCKLDDPDQVFDIPSGCLPPGFEQCDQPAPECN